MMTTSIPSVTSTSGFSLPAVGFGTYPMRGRPGIDAVHAALDLGYRLMDTAFVYDNEASVGRGVATSAVPRDEILYSTKLPGRFHAADLVVPGIEESLYRSGLEVLDLLLMHWPIPSQDLYVEAWQGMIAAREQGLVRHIGVCNFLPEHLDRIIDATGVVPVVNQIEVHPFFPQLELQAYNSQLGILTEGWTPLGRGTTLLEDPAFPPIAAAHGKSVPQVILRWSVQLGVVPLPKSSSSQRQQQNLDLFDFALTEDEMSAISALARPDGRSSNQDPATHAEF